jgi:agmatinase
MTLEPSKPFLSAGPSRSITGEGIYILGFPFDGSTSFRPGARFGPDATREGSYGLETYSPYLDKDTDAQTIFDLGNLELYPSNREMMFELFEQVTQKLDRSHRLMTLGGEHSISYAPIKKYLSLYPDLVVLHLDAHTDMRDSYLNDPYSHASVMKRVEEQLGDQQELFHYGLRSGTKAEFEYLKSKNTLLVGPDQLAQWINRLNDNRPIYITLDLDLFDPSCFPGTGTPEPGGINFHDFVSFTKQMSRKNLVGADVVELAPMLDPSQCSQVLAAKVVRELLLLF